MLEGSKAEVGTKPNCLYNRRQAQNIPSELIDALVYVSLPALDVPLRRIAVRIRQLRRIQLLQVDAQRGRLVVEVHREVADDDVCARA